MGATMGTAILSTLGWVVTTIVTSWLRARPSRPRQGWRLRIDGLPSGSRVLVRGSHGIMIDIGSRSEDPNAVR